MHDLVKKEQKWDWTEKQEKIFEKLKKKFTKKLVLAAPDLDQKMRMEVDVSDYAIRGMLSIVLWQPLDTKFNRSTSGKSHRRDI